MGKKNYKPHPRIEGKEKLVKTPEARLSLPYLKTPIWVEVETNCSLGYGGNRRHPGAWYVKITLGLRPDGKEDRRQRRLGLADDVSTRSESGQTDGMADQSGASVEPLSMEQLAHPEQVGNERTLTYLQAKREAFLWFEEQSGGARQAEGEGVSDKPKLGRVLYPKIKDSLDVYAKQLKTTDPDSLKSAISRIEQTKATIIDKETNQKFGDLETSMLTRFDIATFMQTIITTPPRVRSKAGEGPAYRENWDDKDEDNIRARKVTANRALGDIKAALTHTLGFNGASSSQEWDLAKPYGDVDKSREGRSMSSAEGVRFLNECSPEVRPLVFGGLLIVARYGELRKLKVGDFYPKRKQVHVRKEYTGKQKTERYIGLTDEAVTVVLEICRGRDPEEHMFLRANGKPWGKSQQNRPIKDSAEIINFDACFYSLRHTRISHMLEDGTPTTFVAEIGGTSDQMIRKYYKHLEPDAVREEINKRVRNVGVDPERIQQAMDEIDADTEKEAEEIPLLSFKIESLHPSTYLGKVKGGREDARPKPSKEELVELLSQNIPVSKIAKIFKFSFPVIRDLCNAYGLKRPGLGYHAKLRAGSL